MEPTITSGCYRSANLDRTAVLVCRLVVAVLLWMLVAVIIQGDVGDIAGVAIVCLVVLAWCLVFVSLQVRPRLCVDVPGGQVTFIQHGRRIVVPAGDLARCRLEGGTYTRLRGPGVKLTVHSLSSPFGRYDVDNTGIVPHPLSDYPGPLVHPESLSFGRVAGFVVRSMYSNPVLGRPVVMATS